MTDDVIIPRETAKDIAKALRNVARSWEPLGHAWAVQQMRDWADLLDPPQPSLRDEVASVLLDNGWTCEYHEPDAYCGECRRLYAVTADAVLAVARKHYRERAEGLLFWSSTGNPVMDRRDVLAMFGGDDE